jgi:hypothetical protein
MSAPDEVNDFRDAYKKYLEKAKDAYKTGGTEEALKRAYDAYVTCAHAFWDKIDVGHMPELPAQNWEHFFAFTQTHSCRGPCVSPSFACLGSLGTIGTYATAGGCLGTAGTLGTFGTRGG